MRALQRGITALALYFDASYNGEQIPDVDGAQFIEVDSDEQLTI